MHKQTFYHVTNSVLPSSPAYGKIKATQGRIACPGCGFLLARTLPTTSVTDLLLYCRKCRKQMLVTIPNIEEP